MIMCRAPLKAPTWMQVFAVLVLGAAGAGAEDSRGEAPQPSDATPAITDASRIVALGGDVTEILYALGAEPQIVAVDSTSLYPKDALATKPSVGYLRALSSEGVLSLRPTAIIASESAGPPDVVATLKSAGIEYRSIDNGYGPEAVVGKVTAISAALGRTAEGSRVSAGILEAFATLERERGAIKHRLRAVVILALQNGRATVGGRGSSADAILKLAGLENAAENIDGFKPVGAEGLLELAPDVMILLEREAGTGRVAELMAVPGMAGSPAGRAGRIIEMNALSMLGFGPRTPQVARELMQAVYASPALGPRSDARR
jgi:iron complex transport system substrate-binding protein